MAENPVIPPVPEDRPGKYAWIDMMVEAGWSVTRACRHADVPTISYYKIHRKQSEPRQEGVA